MCARFFRPSTIGMYNNSFQCALVGAKEPFSIQQAARSPTSPPQPDHSNVRNPLLLGSFTCALGSLDRREQNVVYNNTTVASSRKKEPFLIYYVANPPLSNDLASLDGSYAPPTQSFGSSTHFEGSSEHKEPKTCLSEVQGRKTRPLQKPETLALPC